MSILLQAFSVIIYRGISATGHGREVIDGPNSNYKSFLFQLMSTVQLSVSKGCGTQMVMHTGPRTSDVSFSDNLKITCLMRHANME